MGYQLRDAFTGKIREKYTDKSFWDFLRNDYGGRFPVRMPGESVPRPYRYFGASRKDAYWEPTPDEESQKSETELTEKEFIKTLVDGLNEEHTHALLIILKSITAHATK